MVINAAICRYIATERGIQEMFMEILHEFQYSQGALTPFTYECYTPAQYHQNSRHTNICAWTACEDSRNLGVYTPDILNPVQRPYW